MTCLPGLLGATDGLEEWEEGGDSQSGCHHSKRTGGGVANVFVHVVDVGAHGGDHGGQASGFGEVGDDLTSFHASVVILVNQQRLYHHQNLWGIDMGMWHVSAYPCILGGGVSPCVRKVAQGHPTCTGSCR